MISKSLSYVVILLSINFILISSTPVLDDSEDHVDDALATVEVDAMCDCNDPEALYYKIVRQIITDQGPEGKEWFFQEFKTKKPICGTDGKRYNKCEIQCIRMKNPESDLRPVKCQKKFHRKGLKQDKKKSLKLKDLKADLKADQPEQVENQAPPHVCICPRHYFPVCGSNGITYGNMCVFKCAQTHEYPDMTKLHNGVCDKDAKTALDTQH